ncbi:hypothetical protein [Streptomyces sp. NPDC047014]|uniref:hypothetical protein n=1 Tax=Streptomyces sp. NPDC047014 TaxID=3155736 RepID=UPI00340FAD1B
MRSTRRTTTLRTAAVLAGAAAVLALPAGSAFAAPSAGAEPSARAERVERAHVTTVRLADGSVAEVYRTGAHRFEADIRTGSGAPARLVGGAGGVAYGQGNGLHVVLHPNGTVTSWMEGAPKPKPGPAAGGVRVALPDGRVAKLVEGLGGERAEIAAPDGRVLAVVDAKRPSAWSDGWMYRLVQDGQRVKFVAIDAKGGGSGWVYGTDGRLIETYRAAGQRG